MSELPQTAKRKLAAIMFTDLVGFSALSHRDEGLALKLLDEHREIIRPLFGEYGGWEVKTIGDAFMAEFDSALEAVRCAIKIQERLLIRNSRVEHHQRIHLRIGIHLGDVVLTGDDIYGDGVNIASRLERYAPPGGICFSQQVYDQVHNKLDLPITRREKRALKNIKKPIRVYSVVPRGPKGTEMSPNYPLHRRLQGMLRPAAMLVAAILCYAGARAYVSHHEKLVKKYAPAADENRLAVLPFESVGLGAEDEYLPQGVTDELISGLARVPTLRVLGRQSVEKLRSAGATLTEIAAELKAGTFVRGSVQRVGERVAVSVSVVDAQSQSPLWTHEFQDRMENLYELQRRMVAGVANRIRVRQLASAHPGLAAPGLEASRSPAGFVLKSEGTPPNQVAYLSYLKGRFFLNNRTEESLLKGVSHFRHSIDADPGFAAAYVGMANAYGLMGFYEHLAPTVALAKAKEYAEKALEIDPQSADAITSIASKYWYLDRDYSSAEQSFTRAIDLKPGYASGHAWFSEFLVSMNRMPQAKREIGLALELDPLSLIMNTTAGHPDYYSGNYRAAIARYSAALEMDSNFVPARLWLGRAYLMNGQESKAVIELERAVTLSKGSPMIRAALAHAYARIGRQAEAKQILAELHQLAKTRYVSSYAFALIELALGEKERALRLLQDAVQEKSYHTVFLKVDPAFRPVRSEKSFQSLLKKLGV